MKKITTECHRVLHGVSRSFGSNPPDAPDAAVRILDLFRTGLKGAGVLPKYPLKIRNYIVITYFIIRVNP